VKPALERAGLAPSSPCALLAAICLAATACSRDTAIEMASIDKVEPAVVEQGDVLRISGAGFVEGPARVTLSGAFDPSGLVPPEHRVVVIEGLAVSERSIEAAISGVAMRALAAEPLRFDGRVGVEFPSALSSGPAHIAATSAPVTLDIRPAGSGVASAARRAREAEQALQLLGLSLVPTPEGNELLVGSVASGGLADKVGISPGDRLLAVDGVALSTPADLAGLRQDELHRFEVVSRGGRSQVFALRLSPLDPEAADEVTAILLTAIALGLFLAFAAPVRFSRGDDLAPRAVPLADAVPIAAIAVPIVSIPAISLLADARLGATALLFGGAAGGLVVTALYGTDRARDRVTAFCIRVAALAVVPALALAFGASFDVAGAVADQARARWGWTAWRCPFSLAAYLAAAALLWPEPSGPAAPPIARLGAWMAGVFSSMAIAAYGLGGWLVPWAPPEALTRDHGLLLSGIALFAAKTATVVLVARAFSRQGIAERRRRGTSSKRRLLFAAALAAASAAALGWEWADLPAEVASAGGILSAGVFFALAAAFWARLAFGLLQPRRAATVPKTSTPEPG
jgi:hypothetical protein